MGRRHRIIYICWENSSLVNKLIGACASRKYDIGVDRGQ